MNVTDKTGPVIAIKNVNDENDLVIINKSGIMIRLKVAELRVMGRNTQGVKLIDLTKKGDQIASVCKVQTSNNDDEEQHDEQDITTEGGNNIAPETQENNEQ